MPRSKSTTHDKDGYISHNFAHVASDVCEVKVALPDTEVEDYRQRYNVHVNLSSVNNPTQQKFYWSVCAMGYVDFHEEQVVGNKTISNHSRPGELSNLMWAFKHRRDLIAGMMETMCSRSIIEILMHETEVDAESYDILQMYFTQEHQFVLNVLPIRSYTEALTAASDDKTESTDEWVKLFEMS
jgi:uncharacterized protein YlxP (DUF503 family)